MNIEVSTLNTLMAVLIALQAYIVRELFKIKAHIAVMMSHCPHCQEKLNAE
jgi:hypothetical protein